jgi:hypothetical protein
MVFARDLDEKWSDDERPRCGARHMSLYTSEDVDGENGTRPPSG